MREASIARLVEGPQPQATATSGSGKRLHDQRSERDWFEAPLREAPQDPRKGGKGSIWGTWASIRIVKEQDCTGPGPR